MARIAIAGSFGYMDIGDEAMLTEDLRTIRSLGISAGEVLLFAAQTDYVSSYHQHPIANCHSSALIAPPTSEAVAKNRKTVGRRIKKALRFIKLKPDGKRLLQGCDAALITGGGTINSRPGASWSLQRIHSIVMEFRRCGLPVFLSGQTIGPLGQNPQDDRLAKEIVEAVDVLTVRDSLYSRRYMEAIGARPKEFIETVDDACSLPYEDAELPEYLLEQTRQYRTAAVNVTTYTSDTFEKRAFMAELIEQLLKRDIVERITLVSHSPVDLHNLWIINDMVANIWKDRLTIPDTRYWRDDSLKRLISCCDVAIGGRYHFIVFAGTSDTPFVGMTGNHYSYVKQDGFARPIGLTDCVLTERETWDMNGLLARVEAVRGIRLDVARRFPRPTHSMQRFARWLRADLGLNVGELPAMQRST